MTMEQHALAILAHTDAWVLTNVIRNQKSGKESGKFDAVVSKLLYYLILESQKFGGEVLNQFWNQMGNCNDKLKENIEHLKDQPFRSTLETFEVLFQGLDSNDIDFSPVRNMAAEFFTHLGVAFMNPGEKNSGGDSTFSVSEIVHEETEKLPETAEQEENFGSRKQAILKYSSWSYPPYHCIGQSFRRDGEFRLLTNRRFTPFDEFGIAPELAHIIPNAVHGKPNTLKCVAMFGGAAGEDVIRNLNKIGNVMNLQHDAHSTYDNLVWGIEAQEVGGEVRYIFRMVPSSAMQPGPGFITLRDGDEIHFGRGEMIEKPHPRQCNLQLAVARVLKMSGAAGIILKWKDQADDDGLFRLIVSSDELEMVDAKLYLTGRAVVA